MGTSSERILRSEVGSGTFVIGKADNITASADGRWIAGLQDNVVWLLRTEDGEIVAWFDAGFPFGEVRLSPDGTRLFACTWNDLRAWEIPSGRLVFDLREGGTGFDLSPGGDRIVVMKHREYLIFDATTGETLATHPSAELPQTVLGRRSGPAFTADGRWVVFADDTLRGWDPATGEVRVLGGEPPFAQILAGGGSTVFVEARGRLARWDVDAARCLADRTFEDDFGLRFVPREDRVWVTLRGLHHSDLAAFDPDTLERLPDAPITRLPSIPTLAASGDRLWVAQRGVLSEIALSGGRDAHRPHENRGDYVALAFDGDATHVSGLSGSGFHAYNQSVGRWPLAGGERLGAFGSESAIVALAPDGIHFAAILLRGPLVRGTLAETDREELAPKDHGWVNLAAARDGRVFAMNDRGFQILPGGTRVAAKLPSSYRSILCWDPDAELVFMGQNSRVHALDLRTGALLPHLPARELVSIAVVDGLLWMLLDKSVQQWDPRTKTRLQSLKLALGRFDKPRSFAVSPDARLIAVGTSSGALLIETGGAKRRAEIAQDPPAPVATCAFSADGALLATGGSGPEIRVWDVARVLQTAP